MSHANISQKRYLIASVLSPAVKFWLRSQVERVERLDVAISGRNQQILKGYIPSISIAAENAVYRGLHLSQIFLKGENIRINLAQVLKGKPLRLLEPIEVNAELELNEADFNASLKANLLQDAIASFFQSRLPQPIDWQTTQVTLDRDRLTFTTTTRAASGTQKSQPVKIQMDLQRMGEGTLQLTNLQMHAPSISKTVSTLESVTWELGSDVRLQELSLHPQKLLCRGCLVVRSE
ncbi:DUF2993 domain-containing protein [Oscillatoriales cyanobacterium LEGE 11467]|uniref:DUF2993 domain-containing protein n=1 Tax=Zarconia navalis LEGE 11467 TaxID=1828826 RepID=A0A928VXJ9_9CYAN|nr:DUF2993 domain-containing protein [Zarconia navalis]MBE9039988.1 DUF2993 domain-containing protein [Zarconia navalis LEGE 11467]